MLARKILSSATIACVLLGGCKSSEERLAIAQRTAAASAQKERIAAAMAAKKITFASGVRAMNDIDRMDNPDPSNAMRETTLYQEALADKVDTGQISVKEYLYLTEKQRNDVYGKAGASLRQERVAAAAERVADSQPDFAQVYAARLIRGY